MKKCDALKNEPANESYLLTEDNKSLIAPDFTQNQIELLNERRASFINGSEKGIDWQTMYNNIRNNRINKSNNK